MRLTFNTQYVARDGKVYGPLTQDEHTLFWTDGANFWFDNGKYFGANKSDPRDLIAVYTPPAPASFATSA